MPARALPEQPLVEGAGPTTLDEIQREPGLRFAVTWAIDALRTGRLRTVRKVGGVARGRRESGAEFAQSRSLGSRRLAITGPNGRVPYSGHSFADDRQAKRSVRWMRAPVWNGICRLRPFTGEPAPEPGSITFCAGNGTGSKVEEPSRRRSATIEPEPPVSAAAGAQGGVGRGPHCARSKAWVRLSSTELSCATRAEHNRSSACNPDAAVATSE